MNVLRGASRTLTEFHPLLIFEHGYSELYNHNSGELWDLLSDCGYRIFTAEGAGPYPRETFGMSTSEWNYMAVSAGWSP